MGCKTPPEQGISVHGGSTRVLLILRSGVRVTPGAPRPTCENTSQVGRFMIKGRTKGVH